MKKILIFTLCLFAIAFSQFSDKTINFKYSKKTNGSFEESAYVYYQPFIASYMFVHDPLEQHIRMRPERLLYYYPNKNIAIYMNNPDAMIAIIPVQLFVNTGAEDLGLTDMGFELKDYFTRGDTLIRTWELKGKNKDEYLKIDVFSNKDEVYKTISFDHEDKIIKSVRYSDWIEILNYTFPSNIAILENGKTEEYDFSKVKILQALPDSIQGLFSLPENCEIHEYKF